MDEAGVQTSVLTLAAPQPTSADVVRKTNEAAALIKREHPDRFLFCAALPLPDVDAAIREAKYALDTLGADGIKLATNVGGQYLGAPSWQRMSEASIWVPRSWIRFSLCSTSGRPSLSSIPIALSLSTAR